MQPAIVYSEVAGKQAVQRTGDAPERGAVPTCTVVSGQIDLNTGGVRAEFCLEATPMRKLIPQVAGLAKIISKKE